MCFVGPVRRPRVDEGERLLLVVPTRNWSWTFGLLGLGVLLLLVRELNCELAWLLLQLGLLLLLAWPAGHTGPETSYTWASPGAKGVR